MALGLQPALPLKRLGLTPLRLKRPWFLPRFR